MTDLLEPDRDQLEIWIDCIFRHAGRVGFVSLRAFEKDNKPFCQKMWGVGLHGGLRNVFDVAEDLARRAANNPSPTVFCPIAGAVFRGPDHATEQDLMAGLVLSVECDNNPEEARQRLQDTLGEPTLTVKSGGVYINANGKAEDKLHVFYRLNAP